MNQTIDVEDLVPAQVFGICAAVSLGIVQLTAYSGSIDLGTVHTIAGVDMSLAFMLQIVAIGLVAWTNEVDLDYFKAWDSDVRGSNGRKYDDIARWSALGMVLLTVSVEFLPEVNNAVTSSDTLATAVFLVEAAGIWAISWAS